jgi:streptogramin lyase/Tol biopolymer transport system component
MKTLIIAVALAAAVASAALVGAAGPARATYPGVANGRIAFGATLDENTDVYSVMPNGAAAQRLTHDPGADICPAYSADGKWVAWCGPGGIWLMKQNGTEKRQLTTFGAFPDISPDGTKVVFSGRLPAAADPNVFVVNVDGTGLTQLTTDTASDQFPAWSPDGSKIAFTSTRTGIPQVWVMDADGGDQTQLTLDPTPKDQLPDWSPDGSRIAYVQRTAPVGGDIWVVNADRSDPHALTSGPPDELGTAWSPDGTQIAYLNWNTRTVEVMNADGGGAHPVHPLGVQFVPAWQPRGTGLDDSGELSAAASTGAITEYPVPTASSQPLSIVTGTDGHLWFTEFVGNKIGRMSADGVVAAEFTIPTANSLPDVIDVGPDGNLWFAEVLGNRIGRITTDGAITEFLVPTPNSRPTVITPGPDGNLWFSERGTIANPGNKVGRITTDGVITEYTLPNPGSRPLGITAGPDGNVWFAEQAGNRIGRIDPATGQISEFPLPNPGSQPWEITAGPDGNLWFTEFSGNRIGRITPDGTITEFQVPTPASQPNTIRRGPDPNPGDNCAYQRETLGQPAFTARYGSFGGCVARLATTKTLWFTETAGNRVAQVTTDGDIFEYAIPTAGSQPIGIAHGPDGAVWFAELAGNKIGRLDLNTVGKPIGPGVRADHAAPLDPTEPGE